MKDWSGNKTAVYVTNGDSSHSTRERETRDFIGDDKKAVFVLPEKEKHVNIHNYCLHFIAQKTRCRILPAELAAFSRCK